MKHLLLLCVLLVLSCNDNNKNDNAIANSSKSEVVQVKVKNSKKSDSIADTELEIHDFNSFKKYLSTGDDKTYVVNFWATWCKPCIKELPYFEKLNAEYKDENVEVLLVSLDFPSKYDSHLKPYIKENNLQSKVVALDDADSNSWIPQVDKEWSGAIPATVIFNKDKRKFYEGSFTYDQLITEVKPFIE